ncbi:adenosine kinase [Sphingomonas prati]|uniref:Sugar/nucleoside kinase (Ribokinase family) n=1 Tax=Sphingomonas prati TaxID=1843237 RepID=A0A7W9BTN9_9SPHN|nr:adenosine kinase [Sphingomonas prati]MBB5729805.1 sugar/nucleoside kinase (ribokinase family) [Sphingomonas prati]GGE89387.1 adenosine kinase [Sphingomonas prati]
MTAPTLDILAIGNAIVDVIAATDDAFLSQEGMVKGQMQLIDAPRAESLYAGMGPGREVSGGSAANTLAGAAMMGASCGFIGQVADDQLGAVFVHDIRAQGIAFDVPARDASVPTGRCLVLVSEDGQRTMNTFLGAAQFLPTSAADRALVESAAVLLLEGYLWDPAEPRAAMQDAIRIARAAGRKVALGVSATFCILNHHADFVAMVEAGDIDILFANEEELVALAALDDFEAALAKIAKSVPILVVTRGADGAIAIENGTTRHEVAAEPIDRIVDTTGAGDLFAAGFLAGQAKGRSIADSLTMGAVAAAEVISHYGARPETDLNALVTARLG